MTKIKQMHEALEKVLKWDYENGFLIDASIREAVIQAHTDKIDEQKQMQQVHGHFYNLIARALFDVNDPKSCRMRLENILDELETKMKISQ